MPDDITVFISYSHDSPNHAARVRTLANRLREEGISATIDEDLLVPPEGWHLWMEKQIRDAKFVLLICTETYLRRVMREEAAERGLGVIWESTITYSQLYASGMVNTKFIPTVFDNRDIQFIPTPLKSTTYYNVGTNEGYTLLYRRLTNQPVVTPVPLGNRRTLPPLPLSNSSLNAPSTELTPNLVHPYPLQANFTGRKSECQELTTWLSDQEYAIYELVALGGMGKSALTWYWLTKRVLADPNSKLYGVIWWSFYEPNSSFTKFVDEALQYVAGEPIDTELLPTTYDRARELRKWLQTRRVLFVLDGFERHLRDYASFAATYVPDDKDDKSPEARSCVDANAGRFLREIAAGSTVAKVVLTTRLRVGDLEDRTGDTLAGVLVRSLDKLARDDAVTFMRAQGVVKGTSTEIANACGSYGYHPLSLRLLSRLIARDTRMPGDIVAAPHYDVHRDLIQRQHHVLEQSYNALKKRERALISRIAAFRGSMSYEQLEVFRNPNESARFDVALNDLQDRGLLQFDSHRKRYDLHPIVRHYCYDRLKDKAGTHSRLQKYFRSFPQKDTRNLKNIEELTPIIELFHHTLRAGEYQEARVILSNSLAHPLLFDFGAYRLMIELEQAFFPNGEDQPSLLQTETERAWLLSTMAASYSHSGQPRNAVRALESSSELTEKLGEKMNLAVDLANLSNQHLNLGELAIAETKLRLSIELCEKYGDRIDGVAGRHGLARVLTYCGVFDGAMRELETALIICRQEREPQGTCLTLAYQALCCLLMGEAPAAYEIAQQARQLARYQRDLVLDEWLLGAALVMEGRHENTAASHLSDALTFCRRIDLVELEPDVLLTLARWHRKKGNGLEARQFAEEALQIADRSEYRLKQAEIHNFLAHLVIDEDGASVKAYRHAQIAKERAWCDGPPHCYRTALNEAEAMLKQLVD